MSATSQKDSGSQAKPAAANAWTPGPWVLERMESMVELAALKGETLAAHEGYYRDNNGDWIVTYKDNDPEGFGGGRIAGVSFKGTAKRGQTYNAPDPEGQANARLIAAAPDLYAALQALLEGRPTEPPRNDPEKTSIAYRNWLLFEKGRAALSKARGEASS